MLEFVDFSLKFKDKDNLVTVVKKLNFKIEKGERFALVGESGSGKSVTAMSVLRLLPEATVEGKIYWNNIDLLSKDTDIRAIRGKKNIYDISGTYECFESGLYGWRTDFRSA